MKIQFPNVFKITRHIAQVWWEGAKVFKVDAAICVISFLLIIANIFIDLSFDGAIAVLFVYSFGSVLRLNDFRKEINKLKEPEL